jgi:hypothetical protein
MLYTHVDSIPAVWLRVSARLNGGQSTQSNHPSMVARQPFLEPDGKASRRRPSIKRGKDGKPCFRYGYDAGLAWRVAK